MRGMNRHAALSIGTLVLALLACGPIMSQPTNIATEQVAAPIVLESPIPTELSSIVAPPTEGATATDSPTATITPTPTQALPITAEGRLASAHIDALLPTINGERLYDTAFHLANINSRN